MRDAITDKVHCATIGVSVGRARRSHFDALHATPTEGTIMTSPKMFTSLKSSIWPSSSKFYWTECSMRYEYRFEECMQTKRWHAPEHGTSGVHHARRWEKTPSRLLASSFLQILLSHSIHSFFRSAARDRRTYQDQDFSHRGRLRKNTAGLRTIA